MNKLFFTLSMLLCLVHGQSIAQRPGAVRWTRLTDPSLRSDTIHSIKVQSDDKIVVAGNSYQGLYMAIAIGRFDQRGVSDSSFGINGMVTASLDSAHTVANAMQIQSDGKIVVAGSYRKGSIGNFLLARFNSYGGPDSSFGINGIVLPDIDAGAFDVATALAIQTDGKIVAAGRSGSSLALCRYNIDGSPDSSFDSDGKLKVVALGFNSIVGATCVKLQMDSKIVICCGYLAIRLQPDGSLDSGFGTNALATLYHTGYDMAIQKDGKILFTGSGFTLERLDTAGVHDNSFGNGGVVTTPKIYTGSNAGQFATSVCLQADGRIIASGWTQGGGSPSTYHWFAVARYETDGAPDTSFGTLGRLESASLPNFFGATSYSAAITNNNELVLAGMNNYTSSAGWAMVCYYLGPPLHVHTAPRVNGVITVSPNPAENFARLQSTQIANGTWHLSLCDLTGKTLYSETVIVTNSAIDKSISLIDLPAATYLVKLDNGISRMTVKLTKNR
jgi:uncharacterized delta-60 repeat protein